MEKEGFREEDTEEITAERSSTLDYYDQNAAGFYSTTADVQFTQIQDWFLSYLEPGARILNFGRGELVDDEALLAALESGQVARYVTDFPNKTIVGKKGVVALPHLGASTPEAEENCAVMAAREILGYLRDGNIQNSVNFPNAVLDRTGASRLCLLHDNKPGMLNRFLEIIAQKNVNVEHMLNKARGDLAYTIFDTSTVLEPAVADVMRAIPGVRLVRLLG